LTPTDTNAKGNYNSNDVDHNDAVMETLDLPELSTSNQQWLNYLGDFEIREVDIAPSYSMIHSPISDYY